MEFGINIRFFEKNLGLVKAAEFVAKAGFKRLDYTPRLGVDNWKTKLMEDLSVFEDYGLKVHQTHVPFNRYGQYGENHKMYIDRCAEATEITGAEFMVVHGDEFDYENLEFSPDAALDYNYNYFSAYVERAAENGYKVAFETVFEDSLPYRRYTSKADELMSLINAFNSENAVCCWDFGHAHISFEWDAPNIIREFGNLIQCTHLHDNSGCDSHQLPMTGDIKWKETMQAFKDIGYKGVMSIEYSHGSMPMCLAEAFINLTYKAANHIWSL